jgi:hypothetical protein
MSFKPKFSGSCPCISFRENIFFTLELLDTSSVFKVSKWSTFALNSYMYLHKINYFGV